MKLGITSETKSQANIAVLNDFSEEYLLVSDGAGMITKWASAWALGTKLDWLQSLKQFFINVSYHILVHVASLTLMALF